MASLSALAKHSEGIVPPAGDVAAAPSLQPSRPSRRPPSVIDIVNALDPNGLTAASPPPPAAPSRPPGYSTPDKGDARARCIEYLKDVELSIQGQGGSSAMLWACRVAVWGFDLGEGDGYDVIWDHYNPTAQPPWLEHELRKKCRDANDPNFGHPRGWLLHTVRNRPTLARDPSRPVPSFGPLFSPATADSSPQPRDPLADPVTPPSSPAGAGQGEESDDAASVLGLEGVEPTDPYRLAWGFIQACHWRRSDGTSGLTLRLWGNRFAQWKAGAYVRLDDKSVRSSLQGWIESDFLRMHTRAIDQHKKNDVKRTTEKEPPRKLKATRPVVGDAFSAVEQICRIPDGLSPPCWIGAGPPPAELVACRNGLVHVPAFLAGRAGAFIPATPRFVSCVRTDFDFDANAPEPREWLRFLNDIWEGDPASVACLQEWFGYLLTPDTSHHKMLMIVGPPRAGKGTIGRVLTALIGKENCASPALGNLGDRFALADLLDKTVAVFADARLSGRADSVAITEQLLSISGEDARTVELKFKDAMTTTLRTRFVFFSNELPRFGDSSGAIVSRFVFLKLTKTFADNLDLDLLDKLLPELPGILLWAMKGWERLRTRRAFTVPASAAEMRQDADDIASPVKVWAGECCEPGAEFWESTDDLFKSWEGWCERTGRERPGTREHFVRDVLAAMPTLKRDKKSVGKLRKNGYSGIRLLSAVELDQVPL